MQLQVSYLGTFVYEDLCFWWACMYKSHYGICYYSVLTTCWRSLVRRRQRTTPPSGSRTRRPTPACTARRFSSPSSTGDITAGQNQFFKSICLTYALSDMFWLPLTFFTFVFLIPRGFRYDFTVSQAASCKHFQCQNRRFRVFEASY